MRKIYVLRCNILLSFRQVDKRHDNRDGKFKELSPQLERGVAGEALEDWLTLKYFKKGKESFYGL